MILEWKKIGIFVAGMLFSTKGVELLKSDEARDIYVKTTAAGIRSRDEILTEVTAIREECEDIYADALDYNRKREIKKAAKEVSPKVIEDKSGK